MKLSNKIIYQIYPKSFKDTNGDGIGDIQGIISELDTLASLGIDYLWLSPIMVSPQRDNGYDIADFYHIDPMFGSDEDYFMLIKESNLRGIKIMMDLVLNHVSTEHEWFKRACNGDPYYQDFFIWRKCPNDLRSLFGGSAWEYVPQLDMYYFHNFDVHQADLNYANIHVRQEIYKMIRYWIDKGVEGFRLDVIDLIGKNVDTGELSCTPQFYEYLQELHENTFQDKYLTVGECWGATPEQAIKICNGKGLTQIFHFNHLILTHNGSKWDQKKLELDRLVSILETWQNEYQGIEAIVMNNHDLPRLISLWLNDREYRKESAMLLCMLFGMLKGNLYIYQGEEYGMTSAHFTTIEQYRDVETTNYYYEQLKKGVTERDILEVLSKISRDNGRVPMQFTNESNYGFTNSMPWISFIQGGEDIYATHPESQLIFTMYQKIISFRKSIKQELEGSISFKVEGDILFFTKGPYCGVFNFSTNTYPLQNEGEVLFHNYSDTRNYLRAYEAYIYKK